MKLRCLAVILAATLFPALAHAQGSQFTAGPFSRGGFLYVCPAPSGGTPCPSPVAIFADAALSVSVSNPIQMSAGNTVSFYAAGGQYTLQYPATGFSQLVGGGSSSSSPSPSSALFYASNVACGGATNCVQWVDDDTTDNCGAATTAWVGLINAYNGPGYVQVLINGSGLGKAYKFSSCNLAFTAQGGSFVFPGVHIQLSATIDCAQSTANCIQLGLSGMTGYSTGGKTINATLEGGGTIVGCVSLTIACIEVPSYQGHAIIRDIHFANTGAGNATLGNCTNYTVQFDTSTAEPEISGTNGYWTTAGVCVVNNTDLQTGQNTIRMTNNHWGVSAACGSIAHVDGGSHGDISHNSIFGFAINLRLQNMGSGDGGWMIANNSFDNNACAAKLRNTPIQFGGNGSAAVIGPAVFIGNEIPGGGHQNSFADLAGDTTGTLSNISFIGNTSRVGATTLLPLGTACRPACYQFGNASLTTTNGNGFASNLNAGQVYQPAQAANLGATTLLAAYVGNQNDNLVQCTVTLTQAATTSSTLPTCAVTYTDLDSNVSTTIQITPTWASGTLGCFGTTTNVVGNSCTAIVPIINKDNTVIQVTTSAYASVGATPMQYRVFARLLITN